MADYRPFEFISNVFVFSVLYMCLPINLYKAYILLVFERAGLIEQTLSIYKFNST